MRMGFPEEMIAQALKSEQTKLSQMTAKMASSAVAAAAAAVGDGTVGDSITTVEQASRQKERPPKKEVSSPTSSTVTSLQTLRNIIEDKRTRMKKMGFPDDVITNALKVDEEKLAKMMNE